MGEMPFKTKCASSVSISVVIDTGVNSKSILDNISKINHNEDRQNSEKREELTKMNEIRKHIVFHGRVQGVGFRYTAKYMAQSLGLVGWVKNEWDGTVTMEVQGRETLINKLLVGLNQGRYIEIEWMDTDEIPLEKESGFHVR